jgi:hypothetical protein
VVVVEWLEVVGAVRWVSKQVQPPGADVWQEQ